LLTRGFLPLSRAVADIGVPLSNDIWKIETTSPHNKRFKALWGEREPVKSGAYFGSGAYDTSL
jgi:hypothetical protein